MKKSIWAFCFMGACFFILGGEGWAASKLLNIRYSADKDRTRVVLDLEGTPQYETSAESEPTRLNLSLKNLALPAGKQEIPLKDELVGKILLNPANGNDAEVSFSLNGPARWKIFVLSGDGKKPDRLVIDFWKDEKKEIPEKEPAPEAKNEVAPADVEPQSAPEANAADQIPAKEPEQKTGYKFLDLRQWAAPDHTRVVVDLTGRPVYEIAPSPDPLAWSLQLRNIVLPGGGKEIEVNDAIVRRIKLTPAEGDRAELKLWFFKAVRCDVFVLEPYLDKPNRLVVDVFRPDLEQKEKAEREATQKLKAQKTRIVVIDPGHGGEDPGAIGPRKTREKDVVLEMSRKLQKALDETGVFRAFLTRRGDYFVPLSERIKIAREYGADLFISLHANASKKRQARGTSVYCLSLKGASDQAAQMLAQEENASDLIGGIGRGPARRDLDSILLDLEQTRTINESLQLGGMVLGELKNANVIQFPRPMQAGFAVLKAHNIPSILVETAYISHPAEEKNLKKESFQIGIIRNLAGAIKKFIPLLSLREEGGRPERVKEKAAGGV